ncbi:MAG: hypothetical protein CMM25_05650 [Rhodospirillaceae bacterium]|nr:hypothetical protein [Rhodospirillaceae bacterium]
MRSLDDQGPSNLLKKTLETIVGIDNIITDREELSPYGKDIYYEKLPPIAVVTPSSNEQITKIVKEINNDGANLSVRGGGLSYSGGYLTDKKNSVMLNMQKFNKILEINKEDMYVRVESGVTWNQLNIALEPLGLRTPFWGTGSGLYATVGGGASQNAINYGSGRYGTLGESIIGLRLILASGEELRTGSWSTTQNPAPFNRYYGPDLTGLFIGDNGALAIKTEICLQLIPRPTHTNYIAYSFGSRSEFVKSASEIGRLGIISECFGLDPFFLSERITSTGFADDIDKLLNVAKNQQTVFKGIKEAFSVAVAGRRYAANVGYTLHMTVDGRNQTEVDSAEEDINKICNNYAGKPIKASISRIMRGTPFPPPAMMLGPKGDRWVPMHGIVPHSLHETILENVDTYMNANKEAIDEHDLVWGQVSNLIGHSRVLVEINLYWKDKRTDMIESYLSNEFLEKKDIFTENPDAYRAVGKLRSGLAGLFRELGGTHLQIGRSYPFLESRMTSAQTLLKAIKFQIDPSNNVNPGALKL